MSRAEILGNSEVFIKSGNDINLTCVALEAPSPPSFIYWYKSGSVINYSQRGGISVLTERPTKTSKLVIARAMSSDSGNYTCLPSNSGANEKAINPVKLSAESSVVARHTRVPQWHFHYDKSSSQNLNYLQNIYDVVKV